MIPTDIRPHLDVNVIICRNKPLILILILILILAGFFKLLGIEHRFQKTPFSRRIRVVGVGLASGIKLRFQISQLV